MKRLILPLLALTSFLVAGCGSSDAAKPSTAQDVADFKGNPTSPAVQNSLRSHFGGGPPPGGAPPTSPPATGQ